MELAVRKHKKKDFAIVDLPEAGFCQLELAEMKEALRHLTLKVEEIDDCFDLVIDFSRVKAVGTEVLHELLRIYKSLKEKGSEIIICGLNPCVLGVFAATGLNVVFQIVESKDHALRALGIG